MPGPYVVLSIEPQWLEAPWRYDGDERFPHVYGPLARRAIIEVLPIARNGAGDFLAIERSADR